MAIKREYDVVTNVPQWAVCGLVYGDWSGRTNEDKAMAKNYVNGLVRDGWSILAPIDETENEFCSSPAFGLPCSTVDMQISREVA